MFHPTFLAQTVRIQLVRIVCAAKAGTVEVLCKNNTPLLPCWWQCVCEPRNELQITGAFHYAKDSGNFGWNSNGKVRFGFFRLEYSGSLLEVVHLFRLEYSDRNSPFHFWQTGNSEMIKNGKSYSYWLARFNRKMSFHFPWKSHLSLTGRFGKNPTFAPKILHCCHVISHMLRCYSALSKILRVALRGFRVFIIPCHCKIIIHTPHIS